MADDEKIGERIKTTPGLIEVIKEAGLLESDSTPSLVFRIYYMHLYYLTGKLKLIRDVFDYLSENKQYVKEEFRKQYFEQYPFISEGSHFKTCVHPEGVFRLIRDIRQLESPTIEEVMEYELNPHKEEKSAEEYQKTKDIISTKEKMMELTESLADNKGEGAKKDAQMAYLEKIRKLLEPDYKKRPFVTAEEINTVREQLCKYLPSIKEPETPQKRDILQKIFYCLFKLI